jgi:hypothetical protein
MDIKTQNLAITHPNIAKYWHPTKNGDTTPYDETAKSEREVWWQCENGHEWKEKICSRVESENTGCVYLGLHDNDYIFNHKNKNRFI